MTELKEVKIGKEFSEIKKEAEENFRKIDFEIPNSFSREEFLSLKKDLRENLSEFLDIELSNKILVVTGHQPEFHHPGILWKDFLAHKIASDLGGVSLHISVDTDEFEIRLNYPVAFSSNEAIKKHFIIPPDHYGIFKNSKLTDEDRIKLLNHIKEAKDHLPYFLGAESLKFAKNSFSEIELALENQVELSEFLERQRISFLKGLGVKISSVPVSYLTESKAFVEFTKKIENNLSFFIESFNTSLFEYRNQHKIKNPAQPLPEMKQGDMPFWVIDCASKKRLHVPADRSGYKLIPRAITLTMFIRMFLSDFFIHGIGGGRYEAISDNVLLKFFGRGFSNYTISTATMNLLKKNGFLEEYPEEKEIESSLRDLKHSPEKFLEESHPLALEKKALLLKFKDTTKDKQSLHKELTFLNEKMSFLLEKEKIIWENHKKNFSKYKHNEDVFHSRDFPYFYYNISLLKEYADSLT